jgi:hypothetical protein
MEGKDEDGTLPPFNVQVPKARKGVKMKAGELGLNNVQCSTAKIDVSSYVRLV